MAINFKKLEEISKALKLERQSGRAFHTTFAYKKNKLLAIGVNNYKRQHPYHRFGNYVALKENSKNYIAGIHSEVSCIIKLGMQECDDITFVNIRINNKNQPAISLPCMNCQGVLDQVGYKKIYYYDGKKYRLYN